VTIDLRNQNGGSSLADYDALSLQAATNAEPLVLLPWGNLCTTMRFEPIINRDRASPGRAPAMARRSAAATRAPKCKLNGDGCGKKFC
jgi:hypothetical protein